MGNFTKSWHMEVGLNNVASYQVSGQPYASGSISATTAKKIEFPYVTRWVQVYNHGSSDVKVGFSKTGVEGDNYFRIAAPAAGDSPSSARLELKVSELWLSGSSNNGIDVVAGLTTIIPGRTSTDHGTSWSGSVGVG